MQPVYDAGISVYPVRGNHDAGSLQAWHDVFTGAYALPANGPTAESNLTFSATHRNALVVGLAAYGLTNGGLTFDQAELDNPDGDPLSSAEEYVADTSPVDSNDYFRICGIQVTNAYVVAVNCSTARVYSLQFTTNLIEDGRPAVSGQSNVWGEADGFVSLTDTNHVDQRAYRAVVSVP
jgi:hypothetical protein